MINKKSLQWIAWVLILPVLLIRGFTTIYPILKTVINSFYDIRILSGVHEFAGVSNYLNIFKDQKVITTGVLGICGGLHVFPYHTRSRAGTDPEYEI